MDVGTKTILRFLVYTAYTRPTHPYKTRHLRVLNNLRFNVETNRPVLLDLAADSGVKPPKVSVRSLDWTDYEAERIPPPLVSPPLQENSDNGHADRSIPAKIKSLATIDTDTTLLRGLRSSENAGDAESFRGTPWRGLREGGEDALGSPEVILAADVVYDNRCGLYNKDSSSGGL